MVRDGPKHVSDGLTAITWSEAKAGPGRRCTARLGSARYPDLYGAGRGVSARGWPRHEACSFFQYWRGSRLGTDPLTWGAAEVENREAASVRAARSTY